MAMPVAALESRDLQVRYGGRVVLPKLSVSLRRGMVTAIVGPNGCGKSTLLRTMSRLLKPEAGDILLDGREIARSSTGEIARQLAILPQSPETPGGITVWDLVGYGRYPHQGLLRRRSRDDIAAMEWALDVTNLADFRDRTVDTLSGGERQRAWIAAALAQQTGILLLDEPTTFLDISYQLDVLTLVRTLNQQHGLTVGWVLHDLNQAAAFSDWVVLLRDGVAVNEGPPQQVMTPATIKDVFGIEVSVITHPLGGAPICLPNGFCFGAQSGSEPCAACPTKVFAAD